MEIYHNRKLLREKSAIGRLEWRFKDNALLVILYIFLLVIQSDCQTLIKDEKSQSPSIEIENITKKNPNVEDNLESRNHCHSCLTSNNYSNSEDKYNVREDKNTEPDEGKEAENEGFIENLFTTVGTITGSYLINNRTQDDLEMQVEKLLDEALSRDRYEIVEGIEIKTIEKQSINETLQNRNDKEIVSKNGKGRGLFSKYTYEYRIMQKIRNFIDTHILSINIPKAAGLMGFRSFGLKKFFVPLLIGAQVFKSILLAMFLPSILGSFGKILGKGISHLSATSSQASFPPANTEEQDAYNNENKDIMGYETDPAGTYAYPEGQGFYAHMVDPNDVNDLSNVDLSRFGAGGQKVSYLPTRNGYYKNQMASTNNYKVFQKIPASSMILSNYDPFYSPLLSRLDGIFARLGLAQSENAIDIGMQVGAGTQNLSEFKLEACREQLICLMYSSPAKYAPYSNLVSAQLSRELNELRRPVSDNPEILRFFRYMRAARRGQEGVDCVRAHPACTAPAAPAHTMIAAYQDINKLVTARKLKH